MVRYITIFAIVLSFTMPAFAAEKKKKPLLRDGFVLTGVDGKVSADGDKCFFEVDRDVTDDRAQVKAGSKIQMLPSSGLEKIVADKAENPRGAYRLFNAMVTKYKGRNYLFCDYFVPLVGGEQDADEVTSDPNEATVEITINDPNDAVVIPQEILEKLKTKRIIRPERLKKGMELKQDSILADRTGLIKKIADDRWVFVFDAVGRNTSNVTLEILPSQILMRAQSKLAHAPKKIRFKISGIVTKYQGRYYLLLQQVTQAYSHGNFGR